jgi:hypothetical protein
MDTTEGGYWLVNASPTLTLFALPSYKLWIGLGHYGSQSKMKTHRPCSKMIKNFMTMIAKY